MSAIFHRHCHTELATAVSGDGIYLFDASGKKYLDACGGAAVSSLGHSNEAVRCAINAQLNQLSFAHTSFFTTEVADELADKLAQAAPGDLSYVYFVSGGSEAVESALKLARQYFVEKGESQRKRFITRRQSYHGNTLGALAVGGNMWRRQAFEPLLMDVDIIAPCYAYREKTEQESEQDYSLRAANELEQAILKRGADNIIGFIAEPIVGATAGAVPPTKDYFRRIREICDRHGILLILDEVMCGAGRTGTWFAQEQEGIAADIVLVAKGLGAGYQPIGAMICSDEIYNTISSGSGFFQHGHTYLAHACAVAGALAVFEEVEQSNLLENVRQQGQTLKNALTQQFANHPHVGDIRGRGLFLGIELVEDRESKTPFPVQTVIHELVKQQALVHGLMVYPMAGTIDGKNGHHILLAPPFIIDDTQIDELVSKLARSMEVAFDKMKHAKLA